jgi:hypothetical protein
MLRGSQATVLIKCGRTFLVLAAGYLLPTFEVKASSLHEWLTECHFTIRHSCTYQNCSTDTFLESSYVVRFNINKPELEICGSIVSQSNECKRYSVEWVHNALEIALFKEHIPASAPVYLSYDRGVLGRNAFLIVPLLGGTGVIAGQCKAIQ